MKRYAVIDLGTNTFHLLIAQQKETGQLMEVYRERIYVHLAEEGIKTIGPAPFRRGLDALQKFQTILARYPVKKVKAFGTAALRTASNSPEFIAKINATTGIKIEIIPGQEEARLIYLGVKQVVNFHKGFDLIMDIGGGSVEFIIANKEEVKWAESFPIGVAVLYNQFHKNDPISNTEIDKLESFLASTLQTLSDALKKFPITRLIGASGTFDVLEDNLTDTPQRQDVTTFPVSKYQSFHKQIVAMTLEERLQKDKLPNTRADLIVVALLLINTILKLSNAKDIVVSSYAMKEGMLQEMIQSH